MITKKQLEDYMEAEKIMDRIECQMTQSKNPNESELEELGFSAAAGKLKADRELARKMRIAFEHFTVVPPEAIYKFNQELKSKTLKQTSYSTVYDELRFTPIVSYQSIPPTEVLTKVREAKKFGCFDNFQVATIQSVTVVPDPIVFGIINGDNNKYFIAQWDNDVKIEDILSEEEILK